MVKHRLLFLIPILFMVTLCKTRDKDVQKIEEINENYLEETPEEKDNRMNWWRNSKFGKFIHWGPYSVLAGSYKGEEIEGIGEWIMHNAPITVKDYEKIAKEFIPVEFDANNWARLMKDAGMKYVVITSKHHDGFALWDSKVSNYNIVDFTPFRRDILKELSEACKKQGIKFGLYYSIMDWHHPQAQGNNYPMYNPKKGETKVNPDFPLYYENYMKPQLLELVEGYDPDILWFDGEWIPEYTHEMGLELYQEMRALKPSIIINNRVDKGRKGMQGMNKEDMDYAGDFGTPEQEILGTASELDWESCMTMNDTWGYKSYDHNWKTTEILVHNLVDVVSKGGNYLLNVGPTGDGLIPEPSVQRLKEIGTWLSVNGEAIYGTERLANHFKEGENIRFTRKKEGSTLYAISLEKPNNTFTIRSIIPKLGSEIFLLGSDEALKWEYNEKTSLKITIPQAIINEVNSSYAWTFKIEGKEKNDE